MPELHSKLVALSTGITDAITDWNKKQIINELREAKRSSDAGWYATYRVAELDKELLNDKLNPSKSTPLEGGKDE